MLRTMPPVDEKPVLQAGDDGRARCWWSLSAPEYGAYHDEEAQRRGEIVWPLFDLDPNNPLGVEGRPANGPGRADGTLGVTVTE